MDPTLLAATVAFTVVCLLWARSYIRKRHALPLPPGPKGLPIVGNMFELGTDLVHVKHRDWSREFDSDIISVSVFGETTVVLNSIEAITDLLDKRGSNYSDRPNMVMIMDLMGWDWSFSLMRYGQKWREYRRVFQHYFNVISEHRPIQLTVSDDLLSRLHRDPQHFLHHLKHYTAAVILKRVYGYEIQPERDSFVELVDEASQSTSLANLQGAFIVEFLPTLKHIPTWFPGAGFKRQAKEWRKLARAIIEVPFAMVKQQLSEGKASPCYVTSVLEQNRETPDDAVAEDLIRGTAAVSYAAGADTSVSALTTFVLAMVLHQDIQKRVQAELDSVLGGDRLPTFADKDDLPFLGACISEALRWIPILPLGVHHRSLVDDVYKGYFIPGGVSVIANGWAVLHNEQVFPDPEEYKPQRFIDNPDLPDPIDNGVFGFGRRACAGRAMALDTIWIAAARILTVFDIKRSKDADGRDIIPEIKFKPGALIHVEDFPCDMTPRSPAHLALLQEGHN
ncbi:cytochrome P450 [Artomyces pyxidatus]|uniref:Cytochrome P450 n=1 Tax=Artomyces pyxidatus TaxID=48021 RepID=A0ACB8TEW2_9AGAM|nr:cytochrome P450 [Artomyces pyxidatus]